MDINQNVIPTVQCQDAFGKMAWAVLFFVGFGFNKDGVQVDVLPDIIGWMIVGSALTQLVPLSPVRIKAMRGLVYWLTFLSLFTVVGFGYQINDDITLQSAQPFHAISICLTMLLVWRLFGLIADMASIAGNQYIVDSALFRRKFIVISCIMLISMGYFLFIIILPIVLAQVLMVVMLLKRTQSMCGLFKVRRHPEGNLT